MATVTGTVVDIANQPLTGVAVTAVLDGGAGVLTVRPGTGDVMVGSEVATTTNGSGVFSFGWVEDSGSPRTTVRLRHDGSTGIAVALLRASVTVGTQSLAARVFGTLSGAVAATCVVSGSVADPAGAPVVGAMVTFTPDWPDQQAATTTDGRIILAKPVTVTTDANGDFTVTLLRSNSIVGVTAPRVIVQHGTQIARITIPNSATALLAVLLGGTPETVPPVISSISAGTPTGTAATITWLTDEAADSQVDYGLTTAYGSSTTLDTALVTSHSVGLSGLTESTLYHYRVKSKDAAGNPSTSADQTFTTSFTNLVSNPGADTNTTGWEAKGASTLTRETTIVYAGAGSFKVVNPGSGSFIGLGRAFASYIAVSAETTYRLTARINAPVGATVYLAAEILDSAGTFITAAESAAITGTGGWQLATLDIVLPALAARVLPSVYQNPATGATFYVDEVTMVATGQTLQTNVEHLAVHWHGAHNPRPDNQTGLNSEIDDLWSGGFTLVVFNASPAAFIDTATQSHYRNRANWLNAGITNRGHAGSMFICPSLDTNSGYNRSAIVSMLSTFWDYSNAYKINHNGTTKLFVTGFGSLYFTSATVTRAQWAEIKADMLALGKPVYLALDFWNPGMQSGGLPTTALIKSEFTTNNWSGVLDAMFYFNTNKSLANVITVGERYAQAARELGLDWMASLDHQYWGVQQSGAVYWEYEGPVGLRDQLESIRTVQKARWIMALASDYSESALGPTPPSVANAQPSVISSSENTPHLDYSGVYRLTALYEPHLRAGTAPVFAGNHLWASYRTHPAAALPGNANTPTTGTGTSAPDSVHWAAYVQNDGTYDLQYLTAGVVRATISLSAGWNDGAQAWTTGATQTWRLRRNTVVIATAVGPDINASPSIPNWWKAAIYDAE